jgi:hypothetical protein
MRKRIFLLLILSLSFAFTVVGQRQSLIQDYVEKWAATAVREMYRSGVPASITLAQGILESGAGASSMALDGNNHFGIKCHKDWTGMKIYFDDDAIGECFRKYASADESFRDHSDFLRYRDRYKFLFDYETTDYEAWAHGLKKAGYATDPSYAVKLIKYIEDYGLSEYDTMTVAEASRLETSEEEIFEEVAAKPASDRVRASSKADRRAARKARRAERNRDRVVKEEVPVRIPDSPLSIEEPKPVDKSRFEQFRFSLSRQMMSRNGVPFITSIEGETYAGIAKANDLFLKELLRYNDLSAPERLLPGTIVYLQPKKKQSAKGLDKYIVGEDPETLRDICQRFGVKMSAVRKMNGFSAGYVPSEGETIFLRGKKK